MSTEKRLVLFLVLSLATMWGTQWLLTRLGLIQPPRKPPAAAAGAVPGKDANRPNAGDADKAAAKPETKPAAEAETKPAAEGEQPETKPQAAVEAPKVALVPAEKLVLGTVADHEAGGYRLELSLSQRGAGVEQIRSSRWDAERIPGRPVDRPLVIIGPDPNAPPSFVLEITRPGDDGKEAVSIPLDDRLWEVLPDDAGLFVTVCTRKPPTPGAATEGRQITFQTELAEPFPLKVTRVYRLWPGEDGFEMDLSFSSTSPEQFGYELIGPHNLPIEGEWYTSTFRDVFFGGVEEAATLVDTTAAGVIVKKPEEPLRYTTLPLKFAGVENQYFAVFLEPVPVPKTREDSRIDEARTVVIHADPKAPQKADVSVELLAKPFRVADGTTVTHSYRVFAGPKTSEALAPYAATELSAYRKGWSLPVIQDLGASFMAQRVITPMLTFIYSVLERVSQALGGQRGNWGLAIILLTICVRLVLFPLGRKQARMAKKMQDLQPLLTQLKAECGDDKERFAREQFALFRQYGVNPMGGCLPALIQLPVLIGLWQALNNSVALRHSSFLWIENLAAPDMLFKFPFRMQEVPLIGWAIGPYFNLLPILVVGLMLVQTRLFSPPPATPEAQQQQAMMKYMMIFMAVMFYKVPAGLGIYFITSSLWQIGERLLLPKGEPLKPIAPSEKKGRGDRSGTSNGATDRSRGLAPAEAAGSGKGGWWAKVREQAQARIEKIMEEAEKEKSARRDPDPPQRRQDRPRPGQGRKR